MEPDISIGVGVGVAFAFSNSNPSYATVAISPGAGAGAAVDIGNQCYAWVSPTAEEVLSAAKCSRSDPEIQ